MDPSILTGGDVMVAPVKEKKPRLRARSLIVKKTPGFLNALPEKESEKNFEIELIYFRIFLWSLA